MHNRQDAKLWKYSNNQIPLSYIKSTVLTGWLLLFVVSKLNENKTFLSKNKAFLQDIFKSSFIYCIFKYYTKYKKIYAVKLIFTL